MKDKKWFRPALFGLIGMSLGFAYYYFIGCYNGSCLISSNPYISSGYGLGAGVLLGWGNKKKEKKEEK